MAPSIGSSDLFQTGMSDLGGAVQGVFSGLSDQASASADLAQAAMAQSSYEADLLKSQADTQEGQAYGEAASLADLNAQYTAQSTAIQQSQADRTLYQSLGTAKSNIAASGFASGGSGADVLANSAAQGALNRAVLGQQGLITEAGYTEQAASYTAMQKAAGIASQEDIVSAQGEQTAEGEYNAAATAQQTSSIGSFIGAGIKGIEGIAALAAI